MGEVWGCWGGAGAGRVCVCALKEWGHRAVVWRAVGSIIVIFE